MSKLDVTDQTDAILYHRSSLGQKKVIVMRVESSSGKELNLEVQIEPLSLQQRIILGATRFATVVVCAALAILLPVIHFFLVPLLLLLAPWAGYSSYQKHFKITPFDFKCPDCQDTLKVDKKYVNVPIEVSCQNCGSRLKIS